MRYNLLFLQFACACAFGLAEAHVQANIRGGVSSSKIEPKQRGSFVYQAFNNPMHKPILKEHTKTYSGLPIVVAHGMGDSCFNPGMSQITELIGKRVGKNVYSKCIGDGDTQPEDTINGFLMNMNDEVAYFAKKVRADPKLADGFNCVGLSQGNLVLRGYIERFNDPPVRNFISIHGPLAGVASVPHCDPSLPLIGKLCQEVTELLSTAAYTPYVQDLLAQANYLRDPEDISAYLTTSFLPDLNNEVDQSSLKAKGYKANFESLESLVLVKALDDTMIYPKESEWFGFFQDGGFSQLLSYKETKWYQENWFGLKTLDLDGRLHFETTNGDHLRFSLQELYSLLDRYWGDSKAAMVERSSIML